MYGSLDIPNSCVYCSTCNSICSIVCVSLYVLIVIGMLAMLDICVRHSMDSLYYVVLYPSIYYSEFGEKIGRSDAA